MPLRNISFILSRIVFLGVGVVALAVVYVLLWVGLSAAPQQRLPVPSPDGDFFAYLVRVDRGTWQDSRLYELIICAQNGALLARHRASAGTILWSNAGHLALANQERTEVMLIANASGRFVLLAQVTLSPGAEPRWSRDGNKLAYRRPGPGGDEIAIYDFQATLVQRVPFPPGFQLRNPTLLFWSPGSEFLFLLNEEAGQTVLNRLDVVGGEVQVLARGLAAGWHRGSELPRVSPDGTKIYLPRPLHSVIDSQAGRTLLLLPDDADPLWLPWSADGGELFYWRRGEPEEIYAHDFSFMTDQAILAGVQPNGFFTPDGKSYFFRRMPRPPARGRERWQAWLGDSLGWQQVDVATQRARPLARVELWPWEQTVEGAILARQDAYTRVRFGLFDPEAPGLAPFPFPTRQEDVSRNTEAHGLWLIAVGFYAVLGFVAYLARMESAPVRAFYLLSLTAATGVAAWVATDSVLRLELPFPFRAAPAEINGLGWRASDSLPQLAAGEIAFGLILLGGVALVLLAHFAIVFPEDNRFLAKRKAWWPALYGAAMLPLIGLLASRHDPMATRLIAGRLAWIAAPVVLGAWVASLIQNYRRPPHRRAREQVRWVAMACMLVVVGGALVALANTIAERWLASAAQPFLSFFNPTAMAVLGLVAPLAVGHALVSRKPYDIRLLGRRALRLALTAIPVAVVFVSVAGGLSWIVRGSPARPSVPILFLSALLTVLALLPLREWFARLLDRTVDRPQFELRLSLEVLARGLPRVLDRAALVATVADVVRRDLGSQHLYMLLLDRAAGRLRPQPGREPLPVAVRGAEFELDEPLCRYVLDEERPFEVEVSPYSPRLLPLLRSAEERLGRLQAAVLIGLKRRHELLGLMVLGPKASDEFYNADELALLFMVAEQAALAAENIELFEELARDRELRKEMEDASELQARLLPSVIPQMPSCQIAGRCQPARAVRGDYYDFFKLPGQRLALAIGDVSGRGMPASLLMASLQGQLRTEAPTAESLGELMRRINHQLYRASQGAKCCKFFYAIYDCANRRLEFVNAGHNPPLLLTARGTQLLEPTGLPLGLFPEIAHEPRGETVQPGMMLVLYSDGLTEGRNVRGEAYGVDRLAEVLIRSRSAEAQELVEKVFTDVANFLGGAPVEDDQTLVLLTVNPE